MKRISELKPIPEKGRGPEIIINGAIVLDRTAALELRDELNDWIFKTDPPPQPCCADEAQHPPLPAPTFDERAAVAICGVRADSDPKTYGQPAQPIYVEVLTRNGWCRLGSVQDGGGLVAHEWSAAGIRAAKVVEAVAVASADAKAKQFTADKRLVERIDQFGVGLKTSEKAMVESFKKWLESGGPLTEKQRAVALRIDEDRIK